MKILKILRVPVAILVVFMMMTSVAFADWVIKDGEFLLGGSSPAAISIEPGQCETVTVKLSGSGSITGNIEHDYLTYPGQITISQGAEITVDRSVTEYIYANQTELFFELQIYVQDGVDFHEVSFDLFEGCPRMGSGGGEGTYISFGKAVKVDKYVAAQIVVVREAPALEECKEYTVTFDENGGDMEADPQEKQVVDGETLDELPAPPTWEGFSFTGWATTDNAIEADFDEDSEVTANMIVYAVWVAEEVAAVPASYTVTFLGNGGEPGEETETVEEGSTVAQLPEATRDGYNFLEWNTQIDGLGQVFSADTEVYGDMTVYAVWKAEAAAVVPTSYIVTFHGNGGEPGEETVTVDEGSTVGQLPNVTRNGYDFLEWNMQSDGLGQAFTAETEVYENVIVYAIWEEGNAPDGNSSENEDPDQHQDSAGNGSTGSNPGGSQGSANDDQENKKNIQEDGKEDEENNDFGADPDPVVPVAETLKEEDDRGTPEPEMEASPGIHSGDDDRIMPEEEAAPDISSGEVDLIVPLEEAGPVQLEEIEIHSPPADMPTEPVLPEEITEVETRELDAAPELPRTGGFEQLFMILGVAMAAAGVCLLLRDRVKQLNLRN